MLSLDSPICAGLRAHAGRSAPVRNKINFIDTLFDVLPEAKITARFYSYLSILGAAVIFADVCRGFLRQTLSPCVTQMSIPFLE